MKGLEISVPYWAVTDEQDGVANASDVIRRLCKGEALSAFNFSELSAAEHVLELFEHIPDKDGWDFSPMRETVESLQVMINHHLWLFYHRGPLHEEGERWEAKEQAPPPPPNFEEGAAKWFEGVAQ